MTKEINGMCSLDTRVRTVQMKIKDKQIKTKEKGYGECVMSFQAKFSKRRKIRKVCAKDRSLIIGISIS